MIQIFLTRCNARAYFLVELKRKDAPDDRHYSLYVLTAHLRRAVRVFVSRNDGFSFAPLRATNRKRPVQRRAARPGVSHLSGRLHRHLIGKARLTTSYLCSGVDCNPGQAGMISVLVFSRPGIWHDRDWLAFRLDVLVARFVAQRYSASLSVA
jgi:hypothetical protein